MLLGRDDERDTLLAVLAAARAGRGGAVIVRGEPGIGKTALLAELADHGDAARLLRTQGIESEQPLAFAALHRLLQPVLGGIAELPQPQAQALARAFGAVADPGGDDRFLAYLGALSLLTGTDATPDAEGVTLCVIDDAQWLDDASLAALLFVARRIQFSPVAMIFAARDGEGHRIEATDIPQLRLGGLEPETARELIRLGGVSTSAPVLDALVARAAGNPLALLELPTLLTPDQADGVLPLPASLPLTDELERVFTARAGGLTEAARRMLLVAAADDSEDASVVSAAAAFLGVGAPGMDEAVAAGLLAERGRRLTFRHPLVRSALYSAASPGERRQVHAALARAMDDRGDPDRAAWHLAEAADGPDEQVAARLEETGERLVRRGGHEAATTTLERAADLSVEDAARQGRLVAAAHSAWLAGDPARTRRLAQRARLRADPATARELDRLRAFVEMNFGSARLAHGILAGAAQDAADAGDAGDARHYAMVAAALAAFGEDSGAAVPLGADADDGAGALVDPVDACFTALLHGFDDLAHGRWEDGVPLVRRALAIGEPIEGPDLLTNLGIAALLLGDDATALRLHDRQLDTARGDASVLGVLHALTRRAIVQLAVGQWDALEAANREVLDLARATGHPNQRALPLAQLLVVDAYRGRDGIAERADEIAAEARAHPAGVLERITLDTLAWAGAVAVAPTAPDTASRMFGTISLPLLRRMTAMDAAEAAARAGEAEASRAIAADLSAFAATTGNAWAAAAAAHCAALAADDADREAFFVKALEHHGDSLRVLGRARTALAYGEHLRRARRRVDAREHLRAAASLFDALGATPWAVRAADELRATGETARTRAADTADAHALTAQELQVARLVQDGLTNKDVAARLFLSPRTVEFHLRNIFGKLGITSRSALARWELGAPG